MTEIKEIEEPTKYPPFKEACTKYTMDEIFTMAEATYIIDVKRKGGVIDE